MFKKYIYHMFLFFFVFLLFGCGNNEVEKQSRIPYSHLIDSAVEGMNYVCGSSISGFTDTTGFFEYNRNCDVNFTIGGVVIGSIWGSEISKESFFITELIGAGISDSTNANVLLLARFLQTVDDDLNASNGIQITPGTKAVLASSTLDFTSFGVTENRVKAEALLLGRELVSENSAIYELEKKLNHYLNLNLDSAPPVFRGDYNVSVVENHTYVVDVNAVDINSVVYRLGDFNDSNIYEIHPTTGELSFKYAPNFEEYAGVPYEAIIVASDGTRESNVSVFIEILNEQDLRVVVDDSIFFIDENEANGTYVGTLDIREFGDSNIAQFEIFGIWADRFSIDANGTITTNAVLDYEDVHEYNLTARGRNGVDFSNIVDVRIIVGNVAEFVPIIEDINITIPEDVASDTIVGYIPITRIGDTNITDFVFNTGVPINTHFEVDLNGSIRVVSPSAIDYEAITEYNLTAIATNDAGDSNESDIRITILNIPEFMPVVEDANFTIDENVTDAFVVGDVNISNRGDTDIYSVRLSGVSSNHFNIDLNGTISVNIGSDIVYEKKNIYILQVVATNLKGDSNLSDVIINIRNIQPFVTHKITAHDRHKDDFFGSAVAIYGDYVVVGAHGEDTERKNVGAAYIYKKNTSLGADYYSFIYKLQADEVKDELAKKDAFFGTAVAMNETYVAVSSPDYDSGKGVVYLYKRIGNLFELRYRFTSPSGGRFGASLVMDSTYLYVGAPKDGSADNGAVYLYDISNQNIIQSDTITTDSTGLLRATTDVTANSNFGNALAIDGNYLLVGASNKDESNNQDVGAVYMYAKTSSGGFTLVEKILAPSSTDSTTYTPYANEKFGYSVAISGRHILVGSHSEGRGSFLLPTTYDYGSAYLYTINDSEFNITSPDYTKIKLSGEKIEHNNTNEYDNFGYGVAINGDYFAISAPRFDINETLDDDTGRVYLYSFKDTNDTAYIYVDEANITSEDLEENARFGFSVAISDTHLVTSAILKDEEQVRDTGAVYITNLEPKNRPYLINYKPIVFFKEQNGTLVKDYFAKSRNSTPIDFEISGLHVDDFNIDPLAGLLTKSGGLIFDPNEYDFSINIDLTDPNLKSTNYPVNVVMRDLVFLQSRSKIENIDIDNVSDNAIFGKSSDMFDGVAVIGAPGKDFEVNGTTTVDVGAVYLYTRTGNSLSLEYNLTSPDVNYTLVSLEQFGTVVDLDTGVLAVSSPNGTTYGNKSGAVYLFRYDGTADPVFIKKITSNDMNITTKEYFPATGDNFGVSIDQNGSYMAIGASGRNSGAGMVYIFKDFILIDVIENPDIANANLGAGDNFGFSVSIQNEYLVVGAPNKSYNNGDNQGIVYVYERDANDIYNRVQEIRPTDNQDDDSFGYSVALNGKYIAIGAPNKSRQHFDVQKSGAVYVYEKSHVSPVTSFVEREKVYAIDYDYYDYYGYSLDFKGDFIIIGAYRKLSDHYYRAGATFIVKNNGNGHFTEAIDLRLNDREESDEFGTSVALDVVPQVANSPIIYGLSTLPGRGNRGAAYLFEMVDYR
jgi:uncharacterized protein YuzE